MDFDDILGAGKVTETIGKVAIALIDPLSRLAEGALKPYQMKRMSKAEAEAEVEKQLIRLHGQKRIEKETLLLGVDSDSIGGRAKLRLELDQIDKQSNLEETMTRSGPLFINKAPNKSPIGKEWARQWIRSAEVADNEQSQIFWAKIYAQESSDPGSFSVKTMKRLNDCTSSDLELLSKILSYSFDTGIGIRTFIFDTDINNGITLAELKSAEDLGFINFYISGLQLEHVFKKTRDMTRIGLQIDKPTFFRILTGKELKAEKLTIKTGIAHLTSCGLELHKIHAAQEKPNDVLLKLAQKLGFKTIESLNAAEQNQKNLNQALAKDVSTREDKVISLNEQMEALKQEHRRATDERRQSLNEQIEALKKEILKNKEIIRMLTS